MSTTVQRRAPLEVLSGSRAAPGASMRRLRLRQTDDGWSLLGPDGEIVFRAMGDRARRRCLEFARGTGVLAVIS
jgi:hypothetical protein